MLVITHLGGGGSERVAARLAQHLNPEIFEVHLLLVSEDQPGAEPFPSWVTVHRLHCKRVRHAWYKILRFVWIERPQLVLSGMTHLNYLTLGLKLLMPYKTRILIRQNTTASLSPTSRLSRWCYRVLYPKAFRILCQSQDMANDLMKSFAISKESLAVVLNPIDLHEIRGRLGAHEAEALQVKQLSSLVFPHLVAIGRLSNEKGFDLLLPAVAQIKHRYPHVKLTIAGTGPQEQELRRLSYKLNLDDVVEFAGHQMDLTDLYCKASLFVLSSRHEGMPNALLEAAAAGLPIVSTRCCQGVVDLLSQRSLGSNCWQFETLPGTWLTRSISIEALAETLLIAIQCLQGGEPKRFEHSFLAPFELHTAIRAYERVLAEAAAAR